MDATPCSKWTTASVALANAIRCTSADRYAFSEIGSTLVAMSYLSYRRARGEYSLRRISSRHYGFGSVYTDKRGPFLFLGREVVPFRSCLNSRYPGGHFMASIFGERLVSSLATRSSDAVTLKEAPLAVIVAM
jgi:hypothetical protein